VFLVLFNLQLVWDKSADFIVASGHFIIALFYINFFVNDLLCYSNNSPPKHFFAIFIKLNAKFIND
jgi:hypothetical protein